MSQSTRYPAAFPICTFTARTVVKAPTQLISVFGIAKVLQSDQGSIFFFAGICSNLKKLRIKYRQASAYHAQSQGALERFHQTIILNHCYVVVALSWVRIGRKGFYGCCCLPDGWCKKALASARCSSKS